MCIRDRVTHNVPVGRYPFGICLSPDEQTVYVANVGMFEYSMISGTTSRNMGDKAIKYPAFAYGSQDMVKGIENDSVSIPGLGPMNSPDAFSVFTISLK